MMIKTKRVAFLALLVAGLLLLPLSLSAEGTEASQYHVRWDTARSMKDDISKDPLLPGERDDRLSYRPPNNTDSTHVLTSYFTYADKALGALAPGRVEVRFPQHLFIGRSGQGVDKYRVIDNLGTGAGQVPFSARLDSATKEIVFTNTATIPLGEEVTLAVSYTVTPSDVPDGDADGVDDPNDLSDSYYKNDIKTRFLFRQPPTGSTPGAVIKEHFSAETLSIRYDTDTTASGPTKVYGHVPPFGVLAEKLKWTAEQQAKYKDYFFIEWKTTHTITKWATQPYKIKVSDFHTGIEGAELIATVSGQNQYGERGYDPFNEAALAARYNIDVPKPTVWYADDVKYASLIFAYPRSYLTQNADGTRTAKVCNNFTFEMDGYEDAYYKNTVSTCFDYVEKPYQYTGGNTLTVDKRNGPGSGTGAITALEQPGAIPFNLYTGNDATSLGDYSYTVSVPAQGWELTAKDGQYGVRDWTLVITDGSMGLNDAASPLQMRTPLFAGDYEFSHVDVTYSGSRLVVDEQSGASALVSVPYEQMPPCELYAMVDNGPPQLVGQFKFHNGTFRVQKPDGTFFGYERNMPPNATAFELRLTSNLYRIQMMTIYPYVKIKPTDRVLGHFSQYVPTTNTNLVNNVTAQLLDADNKLIARQSRSASKSLTRLPPPGATMDKTGKLTKSNDPQWNMQAAYTLTAWNDLSVAEAFPLDLALSGRVLPEQKEGVFYDLLPLGTQYRQGSASAKDALGRACDIVSVTQTPDWRGTGRTMLTAKVKVKDWGDGKLNLTRFQRWGTYGYLFYVRTGFTFNHILDTNVALLVDNDLTLKNFAAFEALTADLGIGSRPDQPPPIPYYLNGWERPDIRQAFLDVNGNGNPDSEAKRFLHSQAVLKADLLVGYEAGFSKLVRAPKDADWVSHTTTDIGGDYRYLLKRRNDDSTRAKDIVFYDSLEDQFGTDPYWQGTITGVDLSPAFERGVAPVVYTYSGADTINPKLNANHRLRDDKGVLNPLWAKADDPRKLPTGVKAVAIDLSKKTDGTDHVMGPLQGLSVVLLMKAPDGMPGFLAAVDGLLATNRAFNEVKFSSTSIENWEYSNEFCDPVTVALPPFEIKLTKTSDPETGTADAPTIVHVDSPITYRLTATNDSDNLLTDARLVDAIPQGLAIKADAIRVILNGDEANPKTLADAGITLSQSGQELAFEVPVLKAHESIAFLVPVTVLDFDSPAEGILYKNQARIDQVFMEKLPKDKVIESEITYHKPTSVSVELCGTKTVDDKPPAKAGQFSFVIKDAAGQVIETVQDGAGGKLTSKPVIFKKPGDYVYSIEEVKGSAGGITYDPAKYQATVTVKAQDDGTLTASVALTKDGAPATAVHFNNLYRPTGFVQWTAHKELTDMVLKEGAFSFVLKGVDPAPLRNKDGKDIDPALLTVTNTKDSDHRGTAAFPKLYFNHEDLNETYQYTVEELIPDDTHGIAYDTRVYTITVVIKDGGDGNLDLAETVSVGRSPQDDLNFVNAYKAQGAAQLVGLKTLEGRAMLLGEFSFTLTPGEGAPLNDENGDTIDAATFTVTNGEPTDKTASFMFPKLHFTQADIGKSYAYTVTENGTDGSGMTFDKSRYVVTLEISDLGDGKLGITPTILKDDVKADDIHFTNSYKAAGFLALTATKKLDGRTLTADEFSFVLSPVDDAPANDDKGVPIDKALLTVGHNAAGLVSLPALHFTQADIGQTYQYTLREVIPAETGTISYDAGEYLITVTVLDNDDGALGFNSLITKADQAVVAMTFENVYTPPVEPPIDPGTPSVSVDLLAEKKLTGGKLKAGQFSFELLDGAGKVFRRATNDADGRIVFSGIKHRAAGTYKYSLREVAGSEKNIRYDETIFKATVVVSSDGTARVTWLREGQTMPTDPVFVNALRVPATGDRIPAIGLALVSLALLAMGGAFLVRRRRQN